MQLVWVGNLDEGDCIHVPERRIIHAHAEH
jgi:hypothetical protein